MSAGVDKINLAEDKIDKIEHSNEVSDEDKERSKVRKTLRQNSVKGKLPGGFHSIYINNIIGLYKIQNFNLQRFCQIALNWKRLNIRLGTSDKVPNDSTKAFILPLLAFSFIFIN